MKAAGQRLERRLAAIVAADVVGYSRMMGADEVGTFRALQKHQHELVAPAVAKHFGKIFKTTGDGVLAEFGSIVDAVACAAMIQRAMLSRNADVPEGQRIVFRIGVNLGDVIIEGDDVFGDGVNVAARLESVCEPGGVMISRTVHDQIRAKLHFDFEYLGERELKNIAAPVGIYGLSPAVLLQLPEEELPQPPAAPTAEPAGAATRSRRFGGWKVLTGVAVAAIVVAAGAGLGVMIDKARKSQSVVVDLFDAPPALAERGMSGKIVAGGILDELVRMQTATRGSAAKRSLSNAWTGEIKVEIPETGLSITALDRLLRARFGHDLHIDGELVQTGTGGLALSVRGNGILSKTFTGTAIELGKITTLAAEYIYGKSEPSLFAILLLREGRYDEAVRFARTALPGAEPSEQPYILNAWGLALSESGGDSREALALFQRALKLKPDYWVAYINVMNVLWILGDEEGVWRVGEDMRNAAGGRPGEARESAYINADILTGNLKIAREGLITNASQNGGAGSMLVAIAPGIADLDARLHDPDDAELQLQTAQEDDADPSVAAITHFVHGLLASDRGDAKLAAQEMEAFGAGFANPVVSVNYPSYNCWIALAEEAAGHHDKADAVLQAAGTFIDCYRFKGDILDGRDDWPAAQKAYQAAVDLAPDLPAAYYSWGQALARHGDPAGAKAKLEQANRRGPHWADPLKAWGDVLAKEGNWREAVAKYDAALQYAPAWAALQKVRAEAARHGG